MSLSRSRRNKSSSNGKSNATATGNGNTLTLTLNVTFSSGFVGNKVQYMAARDTGNGNSGWQAMGTWGVPGPAAMTNLIWPCGNGCAVALCGTPNTAANTVQSKRAERHAYAKRNSP